MPTNKKKEVKKVTTHVLQEMKISGEKISMLTAYDYTMAKIVDHAGIDVILVGDSASNVMAGHETTLPITLDQKVNPLQLMRDQQLLQQMKRDKSFGQEKLKNPLNEF